MAPATQTLATQETTTITTKKAHPLAEQMEHLLPKIADLLPQDIPFEQFRAALYLELSGRPQLGSCVPESLRDAVIYAASYGLLPGRDCHFLPFKQKKYFGKLGATPVPNYFGLIRAMERTGKIRKAFAHPVHEGDEWSFDMFADRPVHRPAVTLNKKPGKELFYYGAVMFLDGSCAFEVMTLEDLEAIRKRAPAHDSGPWQSDPVMMRRKSCIKRVEKYVKLTPKQHQLFQEDAERELEDIPAERHRQNIIDLFGDDVTGSSGPHGLPQAGGTSTSRRDSRDWDMLREHQGNAALPLALLEQIRSTLSETEPGTDDEAWQVATRIQDHLNRRQEDVTTE